MEFLASLAIKALIGTSICGTVTVGAVYGYDKTLLGFSKDVVQTVNNGGQPKDGSGDHTELGSNSTEPINGGSNKAEESGNPDNETVEEVAKGDLATHKEEEGQGASEDATGKAETTKVEVEQTQPLQEPAEQQIEQTSPNVSVVNKENETLTSTEKEQVKVIIPEVSTHQVTDAQNNQSAKTGQA